MNFRATAFSLSPTKMPDSLMAGSFLAKEERKEKPGVVAQVCDQGTQEAETEDHRLKTSLGSTVSLRPAWVKQ